MRVKSGTVCILIHKSLWWFIYCKILCLGAVMLATLNIESGNEGQKISVNKSNRERNCTKTTAAAGPTNAYNNPPSRDSQQLTQNTKKEGVRARKIEERKRMKRPEGKKNQWWGCQIIWLSLIVFNILKCRLEECNAGTDWPLKALGITVYRQKLMTIDQLHHDHTY